MKKPIYILSCLLLLVAVPGQAKDKHRDNDHNERNHEESRREQDDHDRGEHRGEKKSYKYEHKEKKHHKAPPPGWRNKLNRGARMDDAIYVFLAPPPTEVIAVLPPPPPGVSFRQIEDKIVKINDINRQILEVLDLDKLPIPKPPRLPLPPLPKF